MKTILYNPLSSGFMGFIIGMSLISTSTMINGDVGWINSAIPIAVGLVFTATWWTWLHAYHEAILIGKGIRPNHTIRALQRTFAGAFLSFIPAWYLNNPIIATITGTILCLSLCYLFFDPLLNEYRNIWIFYVSDEPKAAWSDRMWRKIPGKFRPITMVLTKLIILVLATILYYKTIN